jgi:hypothetical protein
MNRTLSRNDDTARRLCHSAGTADRNQDGGSASPPPASRDGGVHPRGRFPRSWLAAAMAGALLLPSPAAAERPTVPSPAGQEILIKSSLLTLNDANVTGNYAVLYAKLAKPVREQFSQERVRQSFKEFVDKKIDFKLIVAKSPVATREPQIDDRGALVLRGYFDISTDRLTYALDFIPSEGEWKPVKLTVNVRPAGEDLPTSSQASQ